MLRSLGLFGFVEQPLFFVTHSLQCVIEPRHVTSGRGHLNGNTSIHHHHQVYKWLKVVVVGFDWPRQTLLCKRTLIFLCYIWIVKCSAYYVSTQEVVWFLVLGEGHGNWRARERAFSTSLTLNCLLCKSQSSELDNFTQSSQILSLSS